jgi:hypothetical protein
MEFKEYVSESDGLGKELNQFFGKAKAMTLSSAKVVDNRVAYKFPEYQNLISIQNPMSLVAHKIIDEVKIPLPKDKAHDKGFRTYRGVKDERGLGIDPEKDWGWKKKQVGEFEKSMQDNIKTIASPLGFLFETSIFLYFTESKNYHDADNGEMRVPSAHQGLIEKIKSVMGGVTPLVMQMVEAHAKDMAEKIEAQTTKFLGCSDMIWFAGGTDSYQSTRQSPADIYVGCSENAEKPSMGYSLKFGTETRINVASLTMNSVSELLGGDPKEFQYIEEDPGSSEWNEEAVDILTDFATPMSAAKYTRILNTLLTGNRDVMPAPRNYASTDQGAPEWSDNIRKDFVVTDDLSNPLKPKRGKGAKVTVEGTKGYMKMRYKVKGGSLHGTVITFRPMNGTVKIQVTNLTSSRR